MNKSSSRHTHQQIGYNSVMMKRTSALFRAMRPNQWLKNLVVYIPIVFNGELFNLQAFMLSTLTFAVFCLMSSASYLLNDIVDLPYDRQHPVKKFRPIASGELPVADASFALFLLVLTSITVALSIRISLGIVITLFFLVHVAYTFYIKRYILFDIFTIAFSFMLRLLGGEIITGYHVPVWLWLTTFFFALFIASVKRHSEFVNQGTKTRAVLSQYSNELLLFLVTSFSVLSIVSYSMYAFVERLPHIRTSLSLYLEPILRSPDTRKWFMVTIPFVVFGIARYAQLLYAQRKGEEPEHLVTHDRVLLGTIFLWGMVLVILIYVI